MSTSARIDELRSKFDENPRRYFAPLANEYRKAGDLEQAIALCREHLPKQPGHMSGHIVFGQALFEHGELVEAQTVFESALELDPENLIALRHLGDIARSRGDALSAKRWYERVLDADPRNDDISSLLASLSQRMTPSVSQSPFGAPNAPTEYAPPVAPTPIEDDPFDAVDSPQWHTPAFLTPLGSPLVSATPLMPPDAPDLLDLDSMADAPVADSASEQPIAFDAALLDEAHDEEREVARDAHDELSTDSSDDFSNAKSDVSAAVSAGYDLGDGLGDFSDDFASEPSSAFDGGEEVALEIPDFLATSFEPDVQSTAAATGDSMLDSASDSMAEVTLDLESMEAPTDDGDPLAVALDAFATNDPFDVTDDARHQLITPSTVSFGVTDPQDALIEVHSFPESVSESVPLTPALDDADAFEEGLVAQEWPDAAVLSSRAFTPARARTPIDSAIVDEAFGREVVEPVNERALEPEPDLEPQPEPQLESEPEQAEVAEIVSSDANDDVDDAERISTAEFDEVALIDEDPPVWSAEAPWSAVAEDEHDVDDMVDVEEADGERNPAFVTETMAELLVAQGFVDRAVTVYEELVVRRPYDQVLTSRLAELRATLAAENAPSEDAQSEDAARPITPAYTAATPEYTATPAYTATPINVPIVAPMARPTARQFFAALASVRVVRRTPAYGAATVSAPTPADGLASLFGEMPVISDDMAARSLAEAFGNQDAMQPGPSLFSPASDEERDRSPVSAAPAPDASSSASSFSFDRFFPDPASASAQNSARESAEGAERGGAVIGSDAGNPTSAAQPSAGEDLAQFASWLKGLSNS